MDRLKYLNSVKELLAAQDCGCQQFFSDNECFLELGYYRFLHEDPDGALECFERLAEYDPRAGWAIFFTKLATNKIDRYPSYFELRSFLEIDLDLCLKYYLGDYVQNVVQYSDWMSEINSEVQKFIARVFLNNGYKNYGYHYLTKARDTFYNDPELHYLFAEYFLCENDTLNAELALENCLEVLPEYYPALKLKSKLCSK